MKHAFTVFISTLFMVQVALGQSVISAPKFGAGAIAPFDGACPTGWHAVSLTKGRFLLGAGSGNTDALGGSLTSRSPASVGGHQFTTGIPASTHAATTGVAAPNVVLAALGLGAGDPVLYVDAADVNTSFSGTIFDSNMPPFYTINFCELN